MGKAYKLTALQVAKAKKAGLYGDGAGLWLQVSDTGTKSWIYRFMLNGKSRWMGLGPVLDVSLDEARTRAAAARSKVREGIDPLDEKHAAKSAIRAAVAKAINFDKAAEEFIKSKSAEWKNAKHKDQWTNTLATYASPTIGNLDVSMIETAHITKILSPIWAEKTETATRLRGRIESVLDWAKVNKYRIGENPARWKGHLDKLLANPSKVAPVEHHPALPYKETGVFMKALRKLSGSGCKAIEFAILTAARSGEVRCATWKEFDLDSALWVVPAERMKAGKEHHVPLSVEAVELLKSLPRIEGNDLVFPAPRGGVLSDMTLTATLRRMDESRQKEEGKGWQDRNGKRITAHGFRSTFRDWAGETTGYPREVIEHAIAHQLADESEAAYARGTLFDKRRRLMADWAKFCGTTQAAGAVIPMQKKAG